MIIIRFKTPINRMGFCKRLAVLLDEEGVCVAAAEYPGELKKRWPFVATSPIEAQVTPAGFRELERDYIKRQAPVVNLP